jgi:holo-[acyl-carrier protein] synthase
LKPREAQGGRVSIYGIGTDLIDIRRIEAALQRHGDRFALRVLGPQELLVWQARRERSAARGVRYVATRFSAKEAFSKAIGLGIRQPMSWRACEILNAPGGRPYVQLHGPLQQWFEAKGLRAHVSVTDETDYATTFVIVEQTPSP